MQLFKLDPYLWVHLAGLVALPFWFALCLLGFAVGYPTLPPAVELGLVAVVGIVPILVMQWFRPFYIYTILVMALKPELLSSTQQRLLRRFKMQLNQVLCCVPPVLLLPLLWQVYRLAPLAKQFVPFPPQWRLLGLGVAAIGFLGCNLFSQVPASVVGVLLTHPIEFETTLPLSLSEIEQGFTILGKRVNRILPLIVSTSSDSNSEKYL